jgi:hypothetical protein
MSDQNHAPDEPVSGGELRELPQSPSLRHLKLEAKRRLAAGEFPNLHDAQLAVAREHGLSSWTALKQHIESEIAWTKTACSNPNLNLTGSSSSKPPADCGRPRRTCCASAPVGDACSPKNSPRKPCVRRYRSATVRRTSASVGCCGPTSASPDGSRAGVVHTNRSVPIEQVNVKILRG